MFTLRKWYLDCVAASGEVAIVYAAELNWRSVSLKYASLLRFDDACGTRVRSSLRGCPEPRADGDRLLLDVPSLGVSGVWEALDPRFSVTLIPGVQWDCVQPRSRVSLAGLQGLGYAEVLTLTIAPWSLPIDELRWGRFASEGHGKVWIEWRGPHPLAQVLVDGKAGEAPLVLEDDAVLRSGRIGETALSIIPNLASMLPGRILGLTETKWRSRGTMLGRQGFAIHEVVRWPK